MAEEMTLEAELDAAIARRNAADQFSIGWFAARNEIEDLANKIAARDLASNMYKPTDQELAVMEWTLSDEYDDE